MKCNSVVRAVAGFFACGCATVLCQGCTPDPATIISGASGGAGGASVTISRGPGGQTGARSRGSGGIVADAASAAVPVTRTDARIEGTVPDPQEPPSKRTDGPQGPQTVDKAATPPDAQQAVDKAAKPDPPVKDAATPPVIDAGSHLDVGAPDGAPRGIDAPPRDGLAADRSIDGGAH